jgi:hypothetical protein
MRRPIPIYLALCAIVPILCAQHGFGQCQYDVQFIVEEKSQNAYSIQLKSETPLTSIKIQLYDLFTGKVLEEKAIPSLTVVSQEVFQNVPPSKYAIIIRTDDCDKPKTLGGIKGISIGIQDL